MSSPRQQSKLSEVLIQRRPATPAKDTDKINAKPISSFFSSVGDIDGYIEGREDGISDGIMTGLTLETTTDGAELGISVGLEE